MSHASRRPTLVIAHRGDSVHAPENTLAAFERAVRLGVDGIECDVLLSRDGKPVVIHDTALSRTTGARGNVWERPLAGLRKLDAGRWFAARYRGERIPTLAEALDLMKGKTIPVVEVKVGRRPDIPRQCRAVCRAIRDAGLRKEAVVSSLDGEILSRLRGIDGHPRLALIVENAPLSIPRWMRDIHPDVKLATPAFIRAMHAAGRRVSVWVVNDRADVRRLAAAGVDGIMTDDPGRLVRALP